MDRVYLHQNRNVICHVIYYVTYHVIFHVKYFGRDILLNFELHNLFVQKPIWDLEFVMRRRSLVIIKRDCLILF